MVGPREPDIRPLQGAVGALKASPGRLELAHTLIALGRILGQAERLGGARGEIAHGLYLTHQVGGLLLAQSARGEAGISGARPRLRPLRGHAALTACERRVAEMAGARMTNREVAQALFVTEKTVATHLTQAYAKLGISSRAELPQALGVPAARPRPDSRDPRDKLTSRELDVLQLVARGLTDAQAASDLVVSTRTVNAHLRSIYRKLDIHSRAAATRYALEHDLA